MQTGISIYPGLDNSLEENLQLMHNASKLGIKRLFTSFHIPETDTRAFKHEIGQVIRAARELGFEIISDISPATQELLGIEQSSLSAYQILGINTLRLDYGYGTQEIARLSRNSQHLRIQLNASTITNKILQELSQYNADFRQIDALHNFYPRPGTGLSEEALMRKTITLTKHGIGIKSGAFIPSQARKRSPLKEGLPTLEMHRDEPVDLTCRHMAAMGLSSVFIGDSLPSLQELESLASLTMWGNDIVRIKSKAYTKNPEIIKFLSQTFTSRTDEAQDAIRAQESRPMLKKEGISVEPEHTAARPFGAVTLDNTGYGRYMGELQIIKRPQPADEKINVVAKILPNEEFLIRYIIPGRKFRLELITD